MSGWARLIQRHLPSLRVHRGSIINVTSVGGELATPKRSFYGATKAAINHLTRSLAIEFAPEVQINAVLSGPVDTPINDGLRLDASATKRLRIDLTAMTPLGCFGRPKEIAQWVCLLLGDTGAWVTGVLLPSMAGAALNRRACGETKPTNRGKCHDHIAVRYCPSTPAACRRDSAVV